MSNRIHISVLSAAVTCLVLGGCTLAKLSGRGVVPMLLNNPRAKVEVIKQVQDSKMIVFDYTGAFDASEILSKHLADSQADAIVNVTITIKSTVGDFFLNLITLGLANSKTIEVTGDLVRAPQGLGSILPSGAEIVAEAEYLEDLAPSILQESYRFGYAGVVAKSSNGYALIRYIPIGE
jgi:hypothetical protein